MARIVCLANSRKHGNKCIAGIDLTSGRWIRPVSDLPDGAVPGGLKAMRGNEPRPLDAVRMPLKKTGRDFGFQPENRALAEGAWQKTGKLTPEDVLRYCEDAPVILHTRSDRVPWKQVQRLLPERRKSLQLVRCTGVHFCTASSPYRQTLQVRARFRYPGAFYDLVVTDPLIEARVRAKRPVASDCLLTISLGGPFPEDDPDPDCYKLVAGVIEL